MLEKCAQVSKGGVVVVVNVFERRGWFQPRTQQSLHGSRAKYRTHGLLEEEQVWGRWGQPPLIASFFFPH